VLQLRSVLLSFLSPRNIMSGMLKYLTPECPVCPVLKAYQENTEKCEENADPLAWSSFLLKENDRKDDSQRRIQGANWRDYGNELLGDPVVHRNPCQGIKEEIDYQEKDILSYFLFTRNAFHDESI